MRRFLRIFPAYLSPILLLAGSIAFLRPEGNTAEAVKHDLPFALLYVANFVAMQSQLSIAWSLSVEEQFYLVVPAILKFLRPALPILLFTAYVVVCLPPLGVIGGPNLPTFFIETTFGPISTRSDPRGHIG